MTARSLALSLLAWLALALMMAGLAVYASFSDHPAWETHLIRGLQSNAGPVLKQVSIALTVMGRWPYYIGIVLGVLLWLIRIGRPRLAVLLVIATLAQPLSGVVKEIVGRQRPLPTAVDVWETLGDHSFPSGHALGAVLLFGFLLFAVEECLANVAVRRLVQAACLAVIVLMGVARVELGAHWPTDVLGGYLMGLLILMPLVWLYRAWVR